MPIVIVNAPRKEIETILSEIPDEDIEFLRDSQARVSMTKAQAREIERVTAHRWFVEVQNLSAIGTD